MKNLMLIFILSFISSCNANDKNIIAEKDLVSKKYFVKGMTCGGCILGVKTALNKSEKLKIVKKEIGVGEATLKFEKSNYSQKITDCEVRTTIEKVTDFKVFLDKDYKKRACES